MSEPMGCVECGKSYDERALTVEQILSSPCCGTSIVEIYSEERIQMLIARDRFTPGEAERYKDLLADKGE